MISLRSKWPHKPKFSAPPCQPLVFLTIKTLKKGAGFCVLLILSCTTSVPQTHQWGDFDSTLTCKQLKSVGGLEDSKDFDGDGLSNFKEANTYRTDPCNPDTDGDFLRDGFEIQMYTQGQLNWKKSRGNVALDPDSDGDGILDSQETWGGRTLFNLQPTMDGPKP